MKKKLLCLSFAAVMVLLVIITVIVQRRGEAIGVFDFKKALSEYPF